MADNNNSIEDLGLSVRAYNCLYRTGIRKLNEITDMTESELMSVRNMGKKTVEEITKKLEEYGLKLKSE